MLSFLEELKIYKYNALEEQVLVKEMQVMTVPTTNLQDSKEAISERSAGFSRA
jgi:hypothetical protein